MTYSKLHFPVMGLDPATQDRYREATKAMAGTFLVSATRQCPCCRKLRSIRQFTEGLRFCAACRRSRRGR